MKIPANYLPVMPYILMNDANAFLEFTKTVFGATEQLIVPREDESIMHAEIKIFDAVVMFAQTPVGYADKSCGMFIYIDDVDAIYKKAIDQKAKSLMTPIIQDYGYTAGFEDPFGNQWWIVAGEKE